MTSLFKLKFIFLALSMVEGFYNSRGVTGISGTRGPIELVVFVDTIFYYITGMSEQTL